MTEKPAPAEIVRATMPAFSGAFATADIFDDFRERAEMIDLPLYHFGGIQRFAGPCSTLVATENPQAIAEAVGEPGRGRILLIDGRAVPDLACLGEIMTQRAFAAGWSGVIVFGAIRDSEAISRLPFGVMALRTTAKRPFGTGASGQRDVDIRLNELKIRPGDSVFADSDAILVLRPERA